MRLQHIQLHNFRQFYGTTPKISFAHGERNVTVVHGCNGAGKTALLNAFTWALYESFSRGFQMPEYLVNKRSFREAKAGEQLSTWVELGVEQDGIQYRIRREAQLQKRSDSEDVQPVESSELSIQFAGPDGRWKSDDRGNQIIGRILPQDLHTYFFFDGERIERIVQPTPDEKRDIAKATKTLLGVEILERSERHLYRARKTLEQELKQQGDPDTAKLIDEKTALEEERDGHLKRQAELASNLEGHQQRKRELEKCLRQLEEASAVQARRDELTQNRERHQASLEKTARELAQLINNSGYTVFLGSATARFQELVEDLRQRGELPAGIKQQFVQDLLTKAMCICERDLPDASEARHAVEAWMKKAGLVDVEEKAIRIGGEISTLQDRVTDFWSRLDGFQKSREQDRADLSRIITELDDIRDKLKHSPKEEESKLEQRLEEVEGAIEDDQLEQGRLHEKIEQKQTRIAELDAQIARQRSKKDRHQLAQRRVKAATDSIACIQGVRSLMETEFRRALLDRVSRLFRSISYTPYVPHIDEDFSVGLLESAGGAPLPVAASQGESQILSLSFIGSIIDLTRDFQTKKEKLPGPDSSRFPVVMDSPFGSLDPRYREQIGEHIPRLADQVIVFVTSTQWRGEVERTMTSRLGRSYVLTYHTPRDDVAPETIERSGKTYELLKRSPNDFEYTEICEVDHG